MPRKTAGDGSRLLRCTLAWHPREALGHVIVLPLNWPYSHRRLFQQQDVSRILVPESRSPVWRAGGMLSGADTS